MNIFSYKVEHDFGLAPNPFGGYCTLAVCRSPIRNNKRLQLDDWVIGTGSRALEKVSGKRYLNRLIYAMKVEEIISFDEYWQDKRFQFKKPVINGTLVQMYGDNIYHRDLKTSDWVQENSAHSLGSGKTNMDHLKRDTSSDKVLISKTFYYFGDMSVDIPKEYEAICSKGRGIKSPSIPKNIAKEFIDWLESNYSVGIHGDPINWILHKDTL